MWAGVLFCVSVKDACAYGNQFAIASHVSRIQATISIFPSLGKISPVDAVLEIYVLKKIACRYENLASVNTEKAKENWRKH
jgi:hypothetical protein